MRILGFIPNNFYICQQQQQQQQQQKYQWRTSCCQSFEISGWQAQERPYTWRDIVKSHTGGDWGYWICEEFRESWVKELIDLKFLRNTIKMEIIVVCSYSEGWYWSSILYIVRIFSDFEFLRKLPSDNDELQM